MWPRLTRSSSWPRDIRRRTHFDSCAAAAALPGDAAYKTYAFFTFIPNNVVFQKCRLPVGRKQRWIQVPLK